LFFRLPGAALKVRFSFFVIPLLIALHRGGVVGIGTWLVAASLAVLLHEAAHAVVARRAGFTPVIELHALGATTAWTSPVASAWTERLAIALAGPVVGFVAAAGTAIVRSAIDSPSLPTLVRFGLHDFLWASLGWAALILVPMLPLDGGQALETILCLQQPATHAERFARQISLGAAGFAALIVLLLGQPVVALLCALYAYDNAANLYGLPTLHQRF
jgi:hypothetical protein